MSSRPNLHSKRFLLQGCACSILVLFLILLPVLAAAESETEEESSEREYRHKIGLFGGNTQDGGDHGASISLEYVYRMGKFWSVGGVAEYAGGDFDVWLLGIPFFIHPHAGWFFRLAPMAEFDHGDMHLVFRTSVGYDFEIAPRWSIAPEFSLDLNRREREFTQVYGVTVLYSF